MKAVRVSQFGGPEVLKIEEVPVPKPGPEQVLVRVRAIGVNPVDTYIRSGSYATHTLPFTPGFDLAGVIESVGENVANVSTGQRVYAGATVSGAYAEFALCDASDVHPLPEKVTFEQGASLGIPYATAYRALFQRANAVVGETVLIHGASGGVGIAATQIARAAGLVVIGTGGTDRGRELVREHGAHHVFDHRSPDYLEKILVLTGGRGVDVILEMLANVNLGKDLPILAKNGRVIVIGSRGKVEILPRDLMARDADIRGMILFATPKEDLRSIHAALTAGLENGTLRPVVGKEMPLADAAKAHVAVLEPGAYGKIILKP